jgi:signal peptidase I
MKTDEKDAKTTKKNESEKAGGFLWETVQTVFYAVLLALVVRIFFYEPFNIPSGSMYPTLLVGDYLFVSKLSYGYSRYSLPWDLPVIDDRILNDPPERGDVVVFRRPPHNTEDFIKRLVGLPGEEIQVRDGILHINGVAVTRELVGETETPEGDSILEYEETLPNGVAHRIFEESDTTYVDNTPVFTVPAGHYFMMGDNRDNSTDSRRIGPIPHENLIGRADIIFFSIDEGAFWEVWKWPTELRLGRFWKSID